MTTRQRIYQLIRDFLELWGYGPTREEICVWADVSKSTVNYHLRFMEKAGCIKRAPGKHRGLALAV